MTSFPNVTVALESSVAAIAWLCWTETMMGLYASVVPRFERAVAIARATGQGYIISNLLAGQAQVQKMLGQLEEASSAADEATEVARLLGSGHQLVFALAQQCLTASWVRRGSGRRAAG